MADINDNLVLEIAFSKAKGIRAATAPELLERIGGLRQFFSLSQAELYHLTGFNSEIYGENYRQKLLEYAESEAAKVRMNHLDAFFYGNEGYPHRLLNCEDAPLMIYKCGSCNLDEKRIVAIVGTRRPTTYGLDFTNRIVDELSKKIDNLLIISGLAYGIDVMAHKSALGASVPTVGVIAEGLCRPLYPSANRGVAKQMVAKGGAIVTEYNTDMGLHKSSFLSRNRIIAGLSDCVIVVESDIKGGSMSTARTAMNYNRDVFAVPGRVNDTKSRGTNMLIANHTATMLLNVDTLIEQMGWPLKDTDSMEDTPQLFNALSQDEQRILDFIINNPEATVNDICVRLSMSYAAVSDLLFQLEMDDIIMTMPGGRFALTTKK